MANLRHMGTGKDLVHQVLRQTGSRIKEVTKQAEAPKPNKKNKLPSPTKFNKGV